MIKIIIKNNEDLSIFFMSDLLETGAEFWGRDKGLVTLKVGNTKVIIRLSIIRSDYADGVFSSTRSNNSKNPLILNQRETVDFFKKKQREATSV